MYIDNEIGDHTSVAEELLQGVPELEQKCKAVDKAVKEGYLNLTEAFSTYGVSEIEYLPYLLLKYNKQLKGVKKQDQVFQTMYAMMSIFDISSLDTSTLNKTCQSLFVNLKKEMTRTPSSQKKIFEKIKFH